MQADFAAIFARKKLKAVEVGTAATAAQGKLPAVAEESKSSKKRKKRKRSDASASSASWAPPAAVAPGGGGGGGKLAQRMSAQLSGAQFRYINEQLYTRPSAEAVTLFADEPRLFDAYHEGFRLQAARWPQRPVQLIADWLKKQRTSLVVADLGCGDAELAATVPQRVHSYDLVAVNERVTACDIAAVPLADSSVDVAVFCLALMGSNFADFLREAHRLLRPRGVLKVAEVASRIEDADGWSALLHAIGFDLQQRDASNTHFVLYDFIKSSRPPRGEAPAVRLKPCIYKKR